MEVKILSSIKEVESIEDQWNILFEENGYIYSQKYSFFKNSIITLDHKDVIFVLAFFRGKELYSVFPLTKRKNKLAIIFNDHLDEFDFLIRHQSYAYDVVKAFHHYVANLENTDLHFSFLGIKSDSYFIKYFHYFFGKSCVSRVGQETIYHKFFEKQNTLYWHLKSKEKSEIKRFKKKTGEMTITFPTLFPSESIDKLRKSMVTSGRRSSNFLNKKMLSFLQGCFEDGLLEVVVFSNLNKACAINFIFNNNKSKIIFIDIYDEKSYRNISAYVHLLEYYNNQATVDSVSFGRGPYQYKIKNFKPSVQPLIDILISNSLLNRVVFLNINWIKTVLKYYAKK